MHTQHSPLCSTYSTLPRLPVRCPYLLGAGAVPVCAETQTGKQFWPSLLQPHANQMDSFISQQGSFSVSRKGTTIQWCVTFYFVPPQNRNCAMTNNVKESTVSLSLNDTVCNQWLITPRHSDAQHLLHQ